MYTYARTHTHTHIYIYICMYRHVHSQARTCANNLHLWVGCRSHGKAWAINTLWTHLESLLVSPVASVTYAQISYTPGYLIESPCLDADELLCLGTSNSTINPIHQPMQNPWKWKRRNNPWRGLKTNTRTHTHTNADALNASHRHKLRAAQVETYTDRKGHSQVCMTLLHHRTPLHVTSPHNQRWSACFFHWFTVIHCSHEVKPWMFSVMNWRPKAPWIFQWVEPKKSERTNGSAVSRGLLDSFQVVD